MYQLLPERRARTRPRKSTVGTMIAVGGMDASKGAMFCLLFFYLFFVYFLIPKL